MARGWWTELADRIGRKAPKEPITPMPAPVPEPASREVARKEGGWDRLLRTLPLLMFLAGALLTACAGLIGGWYVLGFLLLVTSPVVYWLQRIEQRLADQIKRNR